MANAARTVQNPPFRPKKCDVVTDLQSSEAFRTGSGASSRRDKNSCRLVDPSTSVRRLFHMTTASTMLKRTGYEFGFPRHRAKILVSASRMCSGTFQAKRRSIPVVTVLLSNTVQRNEGSNRALER